MIWYLNKRKIGRNTLIIKMDWGIKESFLWMMPEQKSLLFKQVSHSVSGCLSSVNKFRGHPNSYLRPVETAYHTLI